VLKRIYKLFVCAWERRWCRSIYISKLPENVTVLLPHAIFFYKISK